MELALQRYGSYEKFEQVTGGSLLTKSRIWHNVKKYMEKEGCLGEVRGEACWRRCIALCCTLLWFSLYSSVIFTVEYFTYSKKKLRGLIWSLVFFCSCTLQCVSWWICASSLQRSRQQGIKVNELQGKVRPCKKPTTSLMSSCSLLVRSCVYVTISKYMLHHQVNNVSLNTLHHIYKHLVYAWP